MTLWWQLSDNPKTLVTLFAAAPAYVAHDSWFTPRLQFYDTCRILLLSAPERQKLPPLQR
ncbi:hypothetical protein NOVOSPHI9U_20170 [Novosphingobium sp. 9U]|nr:hypothetical protein NOVOSPHI9U_20170 [Novosphingobium sp. 9U]